MIRNDWLESCGAELNTTITEVNGEEVDVWQCTGNYMNHYADTVDGNKPVRFWEHKGPDLKQWDFLLDTFKYEIDDPETVFAIPENCEGGC